MIATSTARRPATAQPQISQTHDAAERQHRNHEAARLAMAAASARWERQQAAEQAARR
jgi:hypothetical protein